MKKLKKMLLTGVALTVATSGVFACSLTKSPADNVQSYAHPTLFTDANVYSSNNGSYMVGGQIQRNKNTVGFGVDKTNVLADAWAQDVLSLIKTGYGSVAGVDFDPKLPVLRSELAVILAEGFSLKNSSTNVGSYTDVSADYWAADWIYGALDAGVMIGYPSKEFKPAQPVTKAEVFATIAQIINVPYTASSANPQYKGDDVKFIPTWAYNATNEVVASNLLNSLPEQGNIVNSEYLSKEQVAYLVGMLRKCIKFDKSIAIDENAPQAIKDYQSFAVSMKLKDRVDAKHSVVGDTFSARTLAPVVINGVQFNENSLVKGKIVQVQRPGIGERGFIKVQFTEIKDGDKVAEFPEQISSATVNTLKNPNILARVAGAPLTAAGRILGVAGRGVGEIVDVSANRTEELGSNLSNVLVETFTLHPGSGVKSLGGSVATVGKAVFDYTKIVTSGVFGMLYELGDETVYMFVPSLSNKSALNPDEEITVTY